MASLDDPHAMADARPQRPRSLPMTPGQFSGAEGTAPGADRLRAAAGGTGDHPRGPDPVGPVMRRAQQGDLDAFRELVETFQNRILRLMIRVLHCDRSFAEDLTQEVFLRVHKGLPTSDGQAWFSTWLRTIAMNVAITEYRKRRALKRRTPTFSIDAPMPGSDDRRSDPTGREVDPGDRAHHHEFAAKVREAVRELPEDFRHAVVLRDMEQMSYEEISETLGIPSGTVRSRIHRGRVMLQQKLKGFV